ncbi:L-type lectin family protein [Myroides sp. LJL115]
MKNILLGLLLMISYSSYGQLNRAFPHLLPLTGTSKPNGITEGTGVNPPTNRYTVDGVYLTEAKLASSSGFALEGITFTSEFGIIVEFDYAMFGGTSVAADGLTLFLFDANEDFILGALGGALGYSYGYDAQNNNALIPGVPGGFLAIGIDHYGNFKLNSPNTSSHFEGLEFTRDRFADDGKNHVTIRGGRNIAGNINEKLGYPMLFTRSVSNVSVNNARYTQAKLNSKGEYDMDNFGFYNEFSLYTGRNSDNTIKYNRVYVEINPTSIDNTQVYVTVKITSNGEERIIVEDLLYNLTTKAPDINNQIYTAQTNYPDLFKIGFSGATGAYHMNQVVRNVRVSLPYEPIVLEDTVSLDISRFYSNKGKEVQILPFANDMFYSGGLYDSPKKGNTSDFIDRNSFRFEDSLGNPYPPVVGSNFDYEDIVNGVLWKYNPTTQEVTAVLTKDFYGSQGESKKLSIYYSAKGNNIGGGPFGHEYYRSFPTLIEIELNQDSEFSFRVNPNMSIETKVH